MDTTATSNGAAYLLAPTAVSCCSRAEHRDSFPGAQIRLGANVSSRRSPNRGRYAFITALLTFLLGPGAHAQFEPEIAAGITYTDNVALEPENEDNELIYSLEPSFHFSKEAARLAANVDYRLQALRYRDLGETDVYHQYDARLSAALIPDNFFVEIGGSRSQSIVDSGQTIPLSNLPISGNRQDRDEYYVAPSFLYAFGNNIAAAGEYRHTWLEYSALEERGNQQGTASFSLDNYRNEHGLAWALRYAWRRAEYEQGIPWEYQQAGLELGFWLGANTRVFGAGGQESAWDRPLDPKMEDEFWETGFSHQIGERLSAEFAAGERSFGPSWRGDLDFQFRRGSTSLSYAETPTTEGRMDFGRGAFDAPVVPDDFLTDPGSTERFILNRLQWTLELEMRRSGLSVYLFDADRTDRTEANGTPLADESERGASLQAWYRLGPRTDFRLGGYWLEREREAVGTSELMRGSVAADYRLGQRTTLTLSYMYAEEDGDSLLAVRDYVANMISVYVTRAL